MKNFYINRIIDKTISGKLNWKHLLSDKIIYTTEKITDKKHLKINIYITDKPFMNITYHDKNGYKSIKEFEGDKVKELINEINGTY